MSVSLLLSPENKEMNDVESLRALWTNVDFYLFREEDAEPKTQMCIRDRNMILRSCARSCFIVSASWGIGISLLAGLPICSSS